MYSTVPVPLTVKERCNDLKLAVWCLPRKLDIIDIWDLRPLKKYYTIGEFGIPFILADQFTLIINCFSAFYRIFVSDFCHLDSSCGDQIWSGQHYVCFCVPAQIYKPARYSNCVV